MINPLLELDAEQKMAEGNDRANSGSSFLEMSNEFQAEIAKRLVKTKHINDFFIFHFFAFGIRQAYHIFCSLSQEIQCDSLYGQTGRVSYIIFRLNCFIFVLIN